MSKNYDIQLASMNQKANVNNPYQGSRIKALTVCSAGLLRSPTMAKFLSDLGIYNTRACGTSQEYALVPITEALILWSDEIHVVKEQADIVYQLLDLFEFTYGTNGDPGRHKPVYIYDIPDQYGTFDNKLEKLIEAEFKRHNKK